MSSLTTLARPYAKAAFELAQDQGDLAGWDSALNVAAGVVNDPTMVTWLDSPELDRDVAVQIIGEAFGGELDPVFGRFLGVLAANDRLGLLSEIAVMFGKLREKAESRLTVRVVSAVPLEADQAERMSAALTRRFDSQIELQNEVDAGVLGGAVIYAGDEVIDGSLKGRLVKLGSSLA